MVARGDLEERLTRRDGPEGSLGVASTSLGPASATRSSPSIFGTSS